MGRSYDEELQELDATLGLVPQERIQHIADAALAASTSGLMVVASGGAKVIAQWIARLHRVAFGSAAVALTPLEYAAIQSPVVANTWLISAGGRHPDIHEAAKAAFRRGDARVTGLIGQAHTPLEQLLNVERSETAITLGLPSGSDGFLATNSVWAMACAIAKAYAPLLPSEEVGDLTDAVLHQLRAWGASATRSLANLDVLRESVIVLHDVAASLGAEDFETRLIEASLSNIWIADFRNFGHGRHFWIADRPQRTAVIALWTPSATTVATSTLDLIPSDVHTHRVELPYAGLKGSLTSLSWSIHATAYWAKARQRDAGRPGVPSFGEKLYEGGFSYPTIKKPSVNETAIGRKLRQGLSDTSLRGHWQEAYQRATERLSSTLISAIVMDMDGTLIESAKRYGALDQAVSDQLQRLLQEGLWIGIATGRGDSAQTCLRNAIPEDLRKRVIVGYHNGACVLYLEEAVDGIDGEPENEKIQHAHQVLEQDLVTRGLIRLRSRAHQLTVSPVAGMTLNEAWRLTKECLTRHGLSDIRLWLSSHSIDVISSQSSKLNVVHRIAELAQCPPDSVLRIGDRGAWPGNDWELLSTPLGISVDECSTDPDTCWNILPSELRGPAGTASLLKKIEHTPNGFRLRVNGSYA